jgi:hypothetical protein
MPATGTVKAGVAEPHTGDRSELGEQPVGSKVCFALSELQYGKTLTFTLSTTTP